MTTLVIATGNPHKVEELGVLFPGVPLRPLSDFPGAPEPIEDAPDFAGNAIIKAKSALAHTGLPSLADDSGICVDCLGGAPGVYSARYVEGTDADRRHALHEAVGDAEDRGAQFMCVIAVAGLPDGLPAFEGVERRDGCYVVTGIVHGRIVDGPERGANGFGYDPIFELPERGLTTAELSAEEKHDISHRGLAARQIAPLLQRWVEGA